jgi:hypothetical protein
MVTYAVDNGYFALVVKVLDGTHLGMKPNLIINLDYPVFGNPHHWPVIPVPGVSVGDNRVEVVITAAEL